MIFHEDFTDIYVSHTVVHDFITPLIVSSSHALCVKLLYD